VRGSNWRVVKRFKLTVKAKANAEAYRPVKGEAWRQTIVAHTMPLKT